MQIQGIQWLKQMSNYQHTPTTALGVLSLSYIALKIPLENRFYYSKGTCVTIQVKSDANRTKSTNSPDFDINNFVTNLDNRFNH